MKSLIGEAENGCMSTCPKRSRAGDHESETGSGVHRKVDLISVIADDCLADEDERGTLDGRLCNLIEQPREPSRLLASLL